MVVLTPNCAFLSETSRMIEIYKALKNLDIPVIIATHGGTYEFIFDREKIPYEIINPKYSHARCLKYIEGVISRGKEPIFTADEIIDQVKNEIGVFKKYDAKVVISGFNLSSKISTSACNIPLLVTHLGSLIPIVIERGLGQFYEYLHNSFTDLLPRRWINGLMGFILKNVKGRIKEYNVAADRFHVPQVKGIADLIMGDYNLITDVPEILGISEDEVDNWRPNNLRIFRSSTRMAYVGPIFANLFHKIPEDVLEFLKTEKPLVYVAMNSGHLKDVSLVCQSLVELDIRAVVCSTVHEITELNEKILVKDFLPSHLIMPHCSLAIINGGQGTVQTAINSGIPIIGFPLQPEQNLNLMLVQNHGAGICMSLFDLRRGKLKSIINEALHNPNFALAAKKMQCWQTRKDGPAEVASLVAQLVV